MQWQLKCTLVCRKMSLAVGNTGFQPPRKLIRRTVDYFPKLESIEATYNNPWSYGFIQTIWFFLWLYLCDSTFVTQALWLLTHSLTQSLTQSGANFVVLVVSSLSVMPTDSEAFGALLSNTGVWSVTTLKVLTELDPRRVTQPVWSGFAVCEWEYFDDSLAVDSIS